VIPRGVKRLFAFPFRRRADVRTDVAEEFAFHLDMRTEELQRLGLSAADARAQALREFGDLRRGAAACVREDDRFERQRRLGRYVDELRQDTTVALRMFARSPGFSAIAILTLALGIGANSAIFSIVNTVLLKPFPFADPDRLYAVSSQNKDVMLGRSRVTALDFLDWQKQNTVFERLAGTVGTGFTFSDGGEPETVPGQMVTADLFTLLGVRPLLGRTLRADENDAGHDRVVILSHALWQRRFAGDPGVLDRVVSMNGQPYTIVGVMPPGFSYPADRFQAWAPLRLSGAAEPDAVPINRSSHFLQVIGRLKPGVTQMQAQQEMSRIAAALATQYADTNSQFASTEVVSLSETVLGPVRPALLLLLAAVCLVLLIACANVMHLLLAQFTARQAELAVRMALGAGRGRIIRQVLTEHLLLAMLGAACGLLLASAMITTVTRLGPQDLPRLREIALDVRVVLFTIGVACASALLFGLLPVLQLARGQTSERALLPGRSHTAGRANTLMRATLIVAEVALSLMLVIGAGVMIRSFLRLQNVDKGFATEHRLAFTVMLPATRFAEAPQMRAFGDELTRRLQREPGVELVGVTSLLPLGGNDMANGFVIDGYIPPRPGQPAVAGFRAVSPDYFSALGIKLLKGRTTTDADREGTQQVAVVNETFARRYLAGRDPIGARFKDTGEDSPWTTIVGVVADVRHRSLEQLPNAEAFFPYQQMDGNLMSRWMRGFNFVVRTGIEPVTIENAIRAQVRELDPQLPVLNLKTMEAMVSESVAGPRFRTLLVGAFGVTAILLAAVGIFGVISYLVSQRTREIGIRIALGAQPRDVRRVVMARALGLTAAGVIVGLAGAWLLRTWLERVLFEVSATDPLTLAGCAILVLGTAWLASFLPARRATRIDPMIACRTE
jgi:putative ABC transport system permease protein